MRIKIPRTANESTYLLLEMINYSSPFEIKIKDEEGGGVIGLDPQAQKAVLEIEECLNAIVNLSLFGKRQTNYSFKTEDQMKDDFTRFSVALKHAGNKKRALEIFRNRVDGRLQQSTRVAIGNDPSFPFQPVITQQNFFWVYAGYLCVDLTRERAITRLKRCKFCKHFFWDSSMNGRKDICWVEPIFAGFDTKPTEHKAGPRYYALYRHGGERSGCLCGMTCFKERHAKRMRNARKRRK